MKQIKVNFKVKHSIALKKYGILPAFDMSLQDY